MVSGFIYCLLMCATGNWLPPLWNHYPKNGKAIDVLVNNAGLVIGVDKEFEGSLDEWDIMIDTNIRGLLAMTRLVVPGMVERGRGHIINIGSIAGMPLIRAEVCIAQRKLP